MAEPLGVTSALLALITFAFQSSITLHDLVKSFESHSERVLDLLLDLDALLEVLRALMDTAENTDEEDSITLKTPLLRCGNACNDYADILLKCSSRSGGPRTSFRDWVKIKYMGDDIDGFRRLLAGYKQTISVALAHANLRTTSATAKAVKEYANLLVTTQDNLQDNIVRMGEKIDKIGDSVMVSESDALEMRLIKEERQSTEECLQICAQLSKHIADIRLTPESDASHNAQLGPQHAPVRMTSQGIQQCKEDIARTAQQLEGYSRELFTRSLDKSRLNIRSEDDRTNLARIQEEWEANWKAKEFCTKAQEHWSNNVSIIENHGTGDLVQVLVSTNDKVIHGKNEGHGRVRQGGGHMNDESLQAMIQGFGNMAMPVSTCEVSISQSGTSVSLANEKSMEPSTKFAEYGRGIRLSSESGSTTTATPVAAQPRTYSSRV